MENLILTEETSLINPGEVWSELHQEIILDSLGGVKKVENEQAVVASIDNILRTSRAERVMLPTFGAGIEDVLFDHVSQATATEISSRIRDNINTWDDRIIINSIDFDLQPDKNFMGIIMSFSIAGYSNVFQFQATIGSGV
jgi:phage baseplate assembly protein W